MYNHYIMFIGCDTTFATRLQGAPQLPPPDDAMHHIISAGDKDAIGRKDSHHMLVGHSKDPGQTITKGIL